MILCALSVSPARAASTLDDIEVYPDRVIFVLDQAVSENISILASPHRLVVDLPDTVSALAQGIQDGRGTLLAKVEAAEGDAASRSARTVLSLHAPVAYRSKWEGGRLTIELLSEDGGPPPAAAPAAVVKPPRLKRARKPAVAVTASTATAVASAPAAPAAKPAAAPVAASAASKGFLIQAGSFSKKESAETFKEELSPAVAGWSVSEITVKGTKFYRLRAGPYATRAQAEEAVKKIVAMGETAIIITAP